MNKTFLGRTALITGAGSGIGRETALSMSREGAFIIVLDLNEQQAQETVELIHVAGGNALLSICDIADHIETKRVVANILKQRPIDILINNAGIGYVGSLEQTSEADLDRLYNVNVKGVYNMMHAVISSMKERQYGVIVNLASIASSVGIAERFAYSMTKGAVLTMTYSVAKDYINEGIRCNCISPARVHTPFVDNFIEKNYPDNPQEIFDTLSQSQPIGRMGTVTEIAALISYLSSDVSAFITGCNFPIDGGFVTLNN